MSAIAEEAATANTSRRDESREEEKELPIIMQTAYAFTADRENAMAAGASEVLVKPITLSALRTCLSKFLPRLQW